MDLARLLKDELLINGCTKVVIFGAQGEYERMLQVFAHHALRILLAPDIHTLSQHVVDGTLRAINLLSIGLCLRDRTCLLFSASSWALFESTGSARTNEFVTLLFLSRCVFWCVHAVASYYSSTTKHGHGWSSFSFCVWILLSALGQRYCPNGGQDCLAGEHGLLWHIRHDFPIFSCIDFGFGRAKNPEMFLWIIGFTIIQPIVSALW